MHAGKADNMMEYNLTNSDDRNEAYRSLLAHLPGIFAVGLRSDSESVPSEIHILATTDRNPKQIVRDVQSALFAAYGLEIDHRIISIAQMPQNPLERSDSSISDSKLPPVPINTGVRLLIAGVESSLKNGAYSISVHLSCDNHLYSGEAKCRDTAIQRCRVTAQATLDAVHQFLGSEVFNLLAVKQTNVWGETIAMTILEYADDVNTAVLIGAALQNGDAPLSIVHSTLDALNRYIGRLRPHP